MNLPLGNGGSAWVERCPLAAVKAGWGRGRLPQASLGHFSKEPVNAQRGPKCSSRKRSS